MPETKLLELVERAAYENLREHIGNADLIRKEANTTMALLLAGAGAALAYVGNAVAMQPLMAAALSVSVYLFALAGLLNWKCLGLVAYPALYNEPGNLNHPEYALEQVRQWELENVQARIDEAAAINTRRSRWLNRCRYAAVATPLVAIIGWASAGFWTAGGRAVAAAVWG